MQHDSNVQTAEAEISNLSKVMAIHEGLLDSNPYCYIR